MSNLIEETKTIYKLDCCGKEVHIQFLYPDTPVYFEDYLSESEKCDADIVMNEEYIENNRWVAGIDVSKEILEYHCSMLAAGNYLLENKRALFHGAAFIWNDLGWILTAPSGTGKTTQLRFWKQLFGKDVTVINGDKPVISVNEDGTVSVSSSPWKGKEKLGHPGLSEKLAGIILLEQGECNKLFRMNVRDAVYPLFMEFVSMPENVLQLEYQGKIEDQLLSSVPVFKLINRGDKDSAILTQQFLLKYLEDDYHG